MYFLAQQRRIKMYYGELESIWNAQFEYLSAYNIPTDITEWLGGFGKFKYPTNSGVFLNI